MMKNRILIICLLGAIFLANNSFGSDKFSIGATGGLSQNNSLSGDLYISYKLKKLEVNSGYSVFGNKASYRGVNDLQFISHGMFAQGNYYLIGGLYGGLRFAFNLNWVDKGSQKLFDNYQNIDSPTFFSGNAVYGQIGYYQQLGKIIGIKLQTQIGVHSYKIAQGWLLTNNSGSAVTDAQFGIERHSDFLYNLSLGLVFKLRR